MNHHRLLRRFHHKHQRGERVEPGNKQGHLGRVQEQTSQEADSLGGEEVEDDRQHRQGQRLKSAVPPQRHQRAERTGGKRRGRQHENRLNHLLTGHTAKQQQHREKRHRDAKQHRNRQQAAEHLAEHDFIIAHVSQEQQQECPAILFLGDRARCRQGGKEQEQCQLDVTGDLKQQQAEAGGLAQGSVLGESDGGLPGGDADDPEQRQRGQTDGVMAFATGDGEEFPVENRTQHAYPRISERIPMMYRTDRGADRPAAPESRTTQTPG